MLFFVAVSQNLQSCQICLNMSAIALKCSLLWCGKYKKEAWALVFCVGDEALVVLTLCFPTFRRHAVRMCWWWRQSTGCLRLFPWELLLWYPPSSIRSLGYSSPVRWVSLKFPLCSWSLWVIEARFHCDEKKDPVSHYNEKLYQNNELVSQNNDYASFSLFCQFVSFSL